MIIFGRFYSKLLFFVVIEHWECLRTLSFEKCCRMHQSTSQMDVWSSSYDFLRSLGRSVARSLGRSVARSLGRSVARSVGRSVDRSIGRSVARSLDRSIGRSLDRWTSPGFVFFSGLNSWIWSRFDFFRVLFVSGLGLKIQSGFEIPGISCQVQVLTGRMGLACLIVFVCKLWSWQHVDMCCFLFVCVCFQFWNGTVRSPLSVTRLDACFVHIGHRFVEEVLHVICKMTPNPRNVEF